MPDVAIVPIRSFRLGKQRLSETLTDQAREQLGLRLASHVATTVADSNVIPLIVSGDADVTDWSIRNGFASIPDPGAGLNAAARAGVEWANESKSRWIVLHSDLPALRPTDLTRLFGGLESAGSVIAPSSDGGTSALGSHAPVSFRYGSASFHRHLPELVDPVVVVSPGLLLDIDEPDDLQAASPYI